MTENDRNFTRWYDDDKLVAKCVHVLEELNDSQQRKTATFLMDHIINKPPFKDMLPDDIFNTVVSETRARRWYDFDEVVRNFIELLRHSNPETRREIAIIAVTFIEDLLKHDE